MRLDPRPRPRWFALAVGLLCACGQDRAEPVARLRLWTLSAGELRAGPAGEERVLLEAPQETLSDWTPVVIPGWDGEPPRASVDAQQEPAAIRLEGAHGGLHRTITVQPGTGYSFTGLVRANGLQSEVRPFEGAGFWLAEARAESSFEALFTTETRLLVSTWTSASAIGRTGWQTRERLFVTGPETRVLHVVCSLAGRQAVSAGSVDFAALRLAELSRPRLLGVVLAGELRRRADIEPPASDWQRARRVSGLLGAEHRPSILLLPGDRLRLPLPPLAAGARLGFGVGPWQTGPLGPVNGRARLRITAGSQELLQREFELEVAQAAATWLALELPLPAAPEALEFELEGDGPLLIGAPLVRTDAGRRRGPNVLLVSIDTLRADHVGAYGYPLATTPNLDRLAAGGLLCRDTSAPAPYTLPSHVTLLSGQFPSVHGVVERDRTFVAARSGSLAETLAQEGYATQAFTNSGFVRASFGLDRGFDGFAEIDPVRGPDTGYFRAQVRRHGSEVAARRLDAWGFEGVRRWLTQHAHEPFFLFLHTYAVHDYDAPERFIECEARGCSAPPVPARTRTEAEAAAYTPEMRAHIVHNYDAALRYTDERLGELLAHLAELGLSEETLIVVTSDHGEEFFEHGHLQHGRTLYEELLAIPLVFHGPGVPPRVLERPAMLIDVAPTILARLGLARDARAQGLDLLGPDWPARPIWSEVDDRFAHKYALREEGGHKTIHSPATPDLFFPRGPEWELYDLARDPGEHSDLAGEPAQERPRAALEELRRRLEALGDSLGAVGHGEVQEEVENELSDLGYGGG